MVMGAVHSLHPPQTWRCRRAEYCSTQLLVPAETGFAPGAMFQLSSGPREQRESLQRKAQEIGSKLLKGSVVWIGTKIPTADPWLSPRPSVQQLPPATATAPSLQAAEGPAAASSKKTEYAKGNSCTSVVTYSSCKIHRLNVVYAETAPCFHSKKRSHHRWRVVGDACFHTKKGCCLRLP